MAGGWRKLGARLRASLQRLTFSETPPRPVDQVILELNNLSGRTVSRAAALSVSPVLNGRNKLCAIATLPIVQLSASNVVQRNTLFEQIDPDVANVVTLAQTIEDLIFDSIAWWEIIAWDKFDYPLHCRRRDPSTVTLQPPNTWRSQAPLPSGEDPRGASVWVDGREVSAKRIIRFDSPNPGLLTGGGAKAIRRWLLLDAAAGLYASDPRPLDYFSPADDADDVPDEEVKKILARWRDARKKRSTGWVPRSMNYHTVDSPTPQQMQLVDLQRQATLDIANAMSLDPEELGVSTTSRTYQNAVDRRIDKVNDVLAPYVRAVTDRLSMGDVTRRGHRVIFWLADYMKSNPTEQLAVHQGYHTMGVLTKEEIRQDLGRPPLPKEMAPPTPPPLDPVAEAERIAREAAQEETEMTNSQPTKLTFSATATRPVTAQGIQHIELDAVAVDFKVERDSRTIWGQAIPYNQIVEKYGMKFRFMTGSMEWQTPVSRHKMLEEHDPRSAIGKALGLTQTKGGVLGKYKLGRSKAADDALADAEDEVRDGLSAGVSFDLERDALWNGEDQCWDVYRADMHETSLTALPAFDDARVTKVAATQEKGTDMQDCAACGSRHAPGQACATRPAPNAPPANQPTQVQANQPAPQAPALQLSAQQLQQLVATPGVLAALAGVPAPQQQTPETAAFTLTAEQLGVLAAQGHLQALLGIGVPAAQVPPVEQRPTVNPTRPTAVTATTDPAPYVFDRKGNLRAGAFDFSTDVINGLGVAGQGGDPVALGRATEFVADYFRSMEEIASGMTSAQFVSQADAATLNPSTARPDLYVDQKEFEYPIWNAISKGTINDATPFILPKFSSSSGLVAAHSEGTEPTPGTFVATAQTITPSPVSGKVKISRIAWDQGGNPQLSGLIWTQMVRGWFEALEASAVALLDGLTPTGLTITTNAVDAALEASLTDQLAPLQYIRGGFRMRDFFLQVDLYKRLIAAKDTAGRKLFPILGAQNATGTTAEFFSAVMVAGLVGRPAWALAATGSVAASSYLFDRADVSGWATAPQRLTFENIEVDSIHLAIWGYKALACTDLTGVREVIYDPTT